MRRRKKHGGRGARRRTATALALLWLAVAAASVALGRTHAASQPCHRLFRQGPQFFLEDLATREARPFEMWNTRLANALYDDRFTERVIGALDDYLRYGVNTICVSVQGGEMGPGRNHLYPASFRADGSLLDTSLVYPRLRRLLAEADRRGMVVIVMIWYHRRHLEVPQDAAVLAATRAFTVWLRATGHRNILFDTVNEFEHPAFVQPGTTLKRPLFHTLDGALSLIRATREEDRERLVGLSPLSALLCPVGWHDGPSGRIWMEADVIFGHGIVADPLNRNIYRLGVSPSHPETLPYVNNEFFPQLRSERLVQKDPRTGLLGYGHWEVNAVTAYLDEIRRIRGFGGSPNVFSHHQQYLTPDSNPPVAEVGPAGTQPELTPGAGEPSMHWLFRAVADLRGFGALPFRLTFDDGCGSGLRPDLAGDWRFEQRRLVQHDLTADPAFARIAADAGDFELTFQAEFVAAPGAAGRLGVQVGAPLPTGTGLRLLIGAESVTLEDAGGTALTRTVKLAKNGVDHYTLRRNGNRASVLVNGIERLALSPVGAPLEPNLLLLTRKASAAFDQVRFTSVRRTDFEDGTAGPWTVDDPSAWSVVARPGSPANRVWEVVVPAGKTRLAAWDRIFSDFILAAKLDLSQASRLTLRFRASSVNAATGPGYTLAVGANGQIDLARLPPTGGAVPLGSATVPVMPSVIDLTATTEGPRILVAVNGKAVIDVTDGPAGPRWGRLQWVASAGRTRIDDIVLEAGPDRLPTVRIVAPLTGKLRAGTAFECRDSDGRMDLMGLRLLVAVGAGPPLDLTLLLHPLLGWFDLAETEDGEGWRFTLRQDVPVGAPGWTLTLAATDRRGRTTTETRDVQ